MVEINSDAEDQLLVEALQEYEDSKFGADTTRMDLKPPGPTSFITPALQGYEDSKFGADTVESTEPKQVYGVKLDFVSERTIKDHHHQLGCPSSRCQSHSK